MPPARKQRTVKAEASPLPEVLPNPVVIDSGTPGADIPEAPSPIVNGTYIPEPIPDEGPGSVNVGAIIDAEVKPERPEILPERKKTEPKSGAPTLDEWQGFFSRIIIRFLTDGYLALAFRGIDEETIAERDLQRLKLTPQERSLIAVPFAEYANKSTFARKHGRKVVAAADSFESMATLALWMGRVNRIARKYRTHTPKPKAPRAKAAQHVDPGSSEQNGHREGSVIPDGNLTIVNPNI